jgi:hypothetical protein
MAVIARANFLTERESKGGYMIVSRKYFDHGSIKKARSIVNFSEDLFFGCAKRDLPATIDVWK